MTQITIDTDEFESMKHMSQEEWQEFAKKAIQDKMRELKWNRFKKIISKSKATEKDVEELTKKAEESMMKHYSKYYEK